MSSTAADPRKTPAVLLVIAGGLIAIGSFLPWITVRAPFAGTLSVSGMDGGGDGVVTLILGIVTALAGGAQLLNSAMPRFLQPSGIVTGIAAGVLMAFDLSSVQSRLRQAKATSNLITGNVGVGVYAVFVGAGFAIIAGLALRSAKRQMAQPAESTAEVIPPTAAPSQPAVPAVEAQPGGWRFCRYCGGSDLRREGFSYICSACGNTQ